MYKTVTFPVFMLQTWVFLNYSIFQSHFYVKEKVFDKISCLFMFALLLVF